MHVSVIETVRIVGCIGKIEISFINDENDFLRNSLEKFFELSFRIVCSRRVVRVDEADHFRFRRDGGNETVDIDNVFFGLRNEFHLDVRSLENEFVSDETLLGKNDFLIAFDQGSDCDVDDFVRAVSYKNLLKFYLFTLAFVVVDNRIFEIVSVAVRIVVKFGKRVNECFADFRADSRRVFVACKLDCGSKPELSLDFRNGFNGFVRGNSFDVVTDFYHVTLLSKIVKTTKNCLHKSHKIEHKTSKKFIFRRLRFF